MIEIDAKVKKWGNSFGIILPKATVREMKLKEDDTIRIMIPPKNDTAEALWGLLGPLGKKEQERLRKSFEEMRQEERDIEWEKMERLSSSTRMRR